MFYKKTIFSTVLVAFSYLGTMAQQTIVSGGGDASGSGGSAGYTVGQFAFVPADGTGGSATPGLQQPFEISPLTATDPVKKIDLTVSAGPNPTFGDLWLSVDGQISGLSFQLFDMKGNLIRSQRIENASTTISFKDLPSALYLLKVNYNSKEIKAFSIIKN